MLRPVFESKAASMGDFYVYYVKKDTGLPTFAVATADLTSEQYIVDRLKHRDVTTTENQVALWSWTSNNLLKLDLDQVKKLVPLASVLKNGTQ